MKGIRWAITGPAQGEMQALEVPEHLEVGECLMRVSHSLISPGTEMSTFMSHGGGQDYYPGYTAVGCIEKSSDPRHEDLIGKPVFLFPAFSDQRHCHASHKKVAPDALFIALPEEMDPALACFARMVNVALTPFCHLDAKTRGTVLVMGLGLVGNLAAQIAGIRGFNVIGADPDESRRGRARKIDLHHIVDPTANDTVSFVRDLSNGRGADLVINATGLASTFLQAVEVAADGGEVSTLGGARGDAGVDLARFLHHVHNRHVTVRGGWEMLLPRKVAPANRTPSTEENLCQALTWLREGTINIRSLWTHTLPPDDLACAYQALKEKDPDYLGVVIDWS